MKKTKRRRKWVYKHHKQFKPVSEQKSYRTVGTRHVFFLCLEGTAGRGTTRGVVFPSKSEQLNLKCSSTRLTVSEGYILYDGHFKEVN